MSRLNIIGVVVCLCLSIWLWKPNVPIRGYTYLTYFQQFRLSGPNALVGGFRFVQHWPHAVCSYDPNLCYKQTATMPFTIHGLWPYDVNNRSMTNCPGTNFNVSSVSTLRPQLDDAWPNFANRPNEVFWGNEWRKHGKCSEYLLPQTTYFSSSLDLYNRINMLTILNAAGIQPNNTYTVQAILNAFGVQVKVICKPSRSTGQLLLYEIHSCVDTGLQDTPCPGTAYGIDCGSAQASVKFLA